MGLTPFEMEEKITMLEKRLTALELEIQNQMGKSLLDLHTMIQEHNEALDNLTLLNQKLVQKVFPKNLPPDFEHT